jgi:hypothetical protein
VAFCQGAGSCRSLSEIGCLMVVGLGVEMRWEWKVRCRILG